MRLTNKAYDILKWIAQYLLPALGTLYFALSKIWNFPYGTEVVGTISAVDAFLGALLGLSSHSYDGDGNISFNSEDLDGESTIELYESVPDILDRGKVTLTVNK